MSREGHFAAEDVRLLREGSASLEFRLLGMSLITTPDIDEPEVFCYRGDYETMRVGRVRGVRVVLTAAADNRGPAMTSALRRAVADAAEAGECRLEAWARIPEPLGGWARLTIPAFRVGVGEDAALAEPGTIKILHGYGGWHADGWVQRLQVEHQGPDDTDETGAPLC